VRLAPEHNCSGRIAPEALLVWSDPERAEPKTHLMRSCAVLCVLGAAPRSAHLGGERSFAVVGQRRRAFTVIELLVVMAIIGVLAVLTIMSFSALGKRSSRAGAAGNVMGLLRGARTAAVDSGLGSLVRIDTGERSLHGIANTVQAAWHFETANAGVTPGAKSMDGAVNGATPGQQGVAGLCFQFNGTNNQYVDCGGFPVYDQTEGIRIEAYVRPEGAPPSPLEGVISKCDPALQQGYILGVERTAPAGTYRAHGGFFIRDANGVLVALHLAYPPAPPGLPPPSDPREFRGGEWHHIAAEFDGFEARLFVDGVRVAAKSYLQDLTAVPPWPGFPPPGRIVPARSTPLCVGRMTYQLGAGPVTDYYFQGRIDEPQVLSVAGGSHFKLPEGVQLTTSAPVVHFNGQGQLDIAYHSQPVYVTVGDPYQTAVLANDAGGTLLLRNTNPFPPTGGAVVVGNPTLGYEVVTYTSASSLTLNVGSLPAIDPGAVGRDSYGTTFFSVYGPHAQGDTVYFARTVKVGATGLVEQIGSAP